MIADNYVEFEKVVKDTYEKFWAKIKEMEYIIDNSDLSNCADLYTYEQLINTIRDLRESLKTIIAETDIVNEYILNEDKKLNAMLDSIELRFAELEHIFMFYAHNEEQYDIEQTERHIITLNVNAKIDSPFTINLTMTGLSTEDTNLNVYFYVNGEKVRNIISPKISNHCFTIGIPLLSELKEGNNIVTIKAKAASGTLSIDAYCSRIMICGVKINDANLIVTRQVAERINYNTQTYYIKTS